METLYDFFAKPTDPKNYTAVQIQLASSESVRQWSHGEIKKPETINYRTFKPERDGLFCAKIFGPTKDYECNCGKYKRMKHRGVICEKCGVEVIQSRVRRERMGHIDLAAPVAHIWFLKSLPSKIGNLLDITLKNMEKVLYFDSYIVTQPGDSGLEKGQLLTEEKYREALESYGGRFEAGIGAEAVKYLLETIDLDEIYKQLKKEIRETNSTAKRQKLAKRLRIVDAFRRSDVEPQWMIMDVIPVLPPDLRPLVPLEGGRFATSDLNDLYRRVINRNNRLKRLVDLNAPDIIVRNEKRMLQESVDVLFDNGRHGRVITGTNKRPLKSLSDTLKGKQGRFRQNLLGKRVDYSGRTVITTGPNLRLHQCGLPKKMALELFKPFVYYRLEQKGHVSTVKSARKLVEKELPDVWDTLEEVVKEYPVLLNRAPTLHRLGIQAFEPILIEGKAIQLHPLVCTAFNADFDGDQMAVHIPLSVESQIEARVLMLSSNNILSPANGSPIIVPSQDIVLGIYYMTREVVSTPKEEITFESMEELRKAFHDGKIRYFHKVGLRRQKPREINPEVEEEKTAFYEWKAAGCFLLKFSHPDEVRKAYDSGVVELHTSVNVRINGEHVDTTVGRIILWEIMKIASQESGEEAQTSDLPFRRLNRLMDKKSLRDLTDFVYRNLGPKATVILSDRMKDIGYAYSTEGGLSISIDAMLIPKEKKDILDQAQAQVDEIAKQYNEGLITQGEKYNKVVDIWAKATDDVAEKMMKAMETGVAEGNSDSDPPPLNPIYMMANSGARGSKDQMRQLAGMRGLMAKPSGEIIETPITANFREGLSVGQYFISTHGARKGLADTALKTANSGYLTRRLADVAQDCIIKENDCGSMVGLEVEPLMEGGEIIQNIGERILGRTAMEDIAVIDPETDEKTVLVKAGDELDEKAVEMIESRGIRKVNIRSILTCKTKHGVCSRCYGRDLSHGKTVEIGQAVGILAAQSIGEPGTQLTMRTFHIGGTASRRVEQADIQARADGYIKYADELRVVENARGEWVVMNRQGGDITVVSENGRELERHTVIYGAHVTVRNGQFIYGPKPDEGKNQGDILATWDPFTTPIITEIDGAVSFKDITMGRTMHEKVDQITGKSSRTIIETKNPDERPRISVKNSQAGEGEQDSARYTLPVDAILLVDEGDMVKAGDVLAKLPRATTKTKDITGGLPRVAELFEVRKPKETATLSEIDGYVTLSKGTKGKQRVIITSPDGEDKKEYQIPRGKHVNVYDGAFVKAGDPLISGSEIPQDILNIKGEVALARYLVDEVQEVYRLQGVRINDKHIEVIVRQMMRRVKVTEVGDTDFITEEQVDKVAFEEENRRVQDQNGLPAKAEPLILGITKASLSTESFISAASFQETTKVLTEASISGTKDYLRGLKENVIMGRLVPAGTGFPPYGDLKIQVGQKK